MPNHARLPDFNGAVLAASVLASAALVSCQTIPDGRPTGTDFSTADSAHARTIVAEGSQGQRLQIVGASDGSWTGLLDRRGEQIRTDVATCREFAEAMDMFRRLPALKPGPYELQPHPQVRPIPPTTMDGEFWVITTPGFFPDWSDVMVVIRGDQGPYANWASETARVIAGCDGR